MTIFKKK